jgi:predicted  nucleic acid-binding Zn-ribbon protein
LAKKSATQELDKIKQSESMVTKMEKVALQKAGLEKADMDSVKMSDNDFNQKMDAAQQNSEKTQSQVSDLQKKLDALKAQMNKPGMDEKAKKDLEKQIEQTQKGLEQAQKDAAQAQKDMESMQLSKEARDTLKKIFDDPMWKKIQEAAKKIKQSAEQAAKTGQPKLTKEERQQLQKEM